MFDELKKRFEKNMLPPDEHGCIEWHTKRTPKRGHYPQFTMRASRMSHILYKGDVPEELIILHSCDNPACVNPEHLRAGTSSENTKEWHQRKKIIHPKKQKVVKVKKSQGNYKLNIIQVIRIKQQHEKGKSIQYLAEKNKVKESTIHSIISGKTWKEIS